MITTSITRGVSKGLAQSITGGALDPLANLIKKAFGNGEQGTLYVPQPVIGGQQVLFQDYQMTIPVTAPDDPVGAMLDLSGNGNHATQPTSAARPIYRTDGVLHWLEFDGVDDWMRSVFSSAIAQPLTNALAIAERNESSGVALIDSSDVKLRSLLVFLSSNTGGGRIQSFDTVAEVETGISRPLQKTVIAQRANGVNSLHRRDGVLVSTVNGGEDGTNGITIGANGEATPIGFSKSDYYGGIVAAGEPDFQKIENYLASLAGVTLP